MEIETTSRSVPGLLQSEAKETDGIPQELARYGRNIQLPGFGEAGQRRLAASSALVLGAGALGSVVAAYLAGSGVGRIGLVDFDNIEPSNLQRQVLYSEAQAGLPKCRVLAERLRSLNSEIRVVCHPQLFRADNARTLMGDYDILVECSDNPATKRLGVSAARQLGRTAVVGGVAGFRGQVSVFLPDSPSYEDVFPGDGCSAFLPCGQDGVFGPTAGLVACLQAGEALKRLAGHPDAMAAGLLTVDLSNLSFRSFRF